MRLRNFSLEKGERGAPRGGRRARRPRVCAGRGTGPSGASVASCMRRKAGTGPGPRGTALEVVATRGVEKETNHEPVATLEGERLFLLC
jgi:hypothetical protein